MMKCNFNPETGRLVFEVQGETAKEIFKQLADCQNVFGATKRCEFCQCEILRYVHVVRKGFDFYEVVCTGCNSQFKFGQLKDQTGLFPKGWVRRGSTGDSPDDYDPEFDQAPPPPPPPRQQAQQPPPLHSQGNPPPRQTPPTAGTRQAAENLTYEPPPPPRRGGYR
jgi:hypothetical protein